MVKTQSLASFTSRNARGKASFTTIRTARFLSGPGDSLFLVKRPPHWPLAYLVGTPRKGEVGYALNKSRPLVR